MLNGGSIRQTVARKYQLKRRAERQAETRHRIVAATVELHQTIGPARTTVAAIAEKAGVERLTFYRHFPDPGSLFEACAAHSFATDPLPAVEEWTTISDPRSRLRAALAASYAFYRAHEHLMTVIFRDREAGLPVGGGFLAYQDRAAKAVADAWPATPDVAAVIAHALDFHAWRSLAIRQGLADARVVELMSALVVAATRAPLSAG